MFICIRLAATVTVMKNKLTELLQSTVVETEMHACIKRMAI